MLPAQRLLLAQTAAVQLQTDDWDATTYLAAADLFGSARGTLFFVVDAVNGDAIETEAYVNSGSSGSWTLGFEWDFVGSDIQMVPGRSYYVEGDIGQHEQEPDWYRIRLTSYSDEVSDSDETVLGTHEVVASTAYPTAFTTPAWELPAGAVRLEMRVWTRLSAPATARTEGMKFRNLNLRSDA